MLSALCRRRRAPANPLLWTAAWRPDGRRTRAVQTIRCVCSLRPPRVFGSVRPTVRRGCQSCWGQRKPERERQSPARLYHHHGQERQQVIQPPRLDIEADGGQVASESVRVAVVFQVASASRTERSLLLRQRLIRPIFSDCIPEPNPKPMEGVAQGAPDFSARARRNRVRIGSTLKGTSSLWREATFLRKCVPSHALPLGGAPARPSPARTATLECVTCLSCQKQQNAGAADRA